MYNSAPSIAPSKTKLIFNIHTCLSKWHNSRQTWLIFNSGSWDIWESDYYHIMLHLINCWYLELLFVMVPIDWISIKKCIQIHHNTQKITKMRCICNTIFPKICIFSNASAGFKQFKQFPIKRYAICCCSTKSTKTNEPQSAA